MTTERKHREVGRRRQGFTLMEILVVVAIIVLMIGMAVPLFNTLTGSRSEESAENQVQAILATARSEAMALQTPTGVLFYLDPKTSRVNGVLVRAVQTELMEETVVDNAQIEVMLDVMDREPVTFPPGVSMQLIDNATTGAANPKWSDYNDDRYIGFAPIANGSIPVGGVILFDGRGQLTTRRYAFPRALNGSNGWKRTAAAQLFYPEAGNSLDSKNIEFRDQKLPPAEDKLAPRSGFGIVLFNREAFLGAGHTEDDPQFAGGSYDTAEKQEELWIDENSIPLVVNRYNGTLIRGEP